MKKEQDWLFTSEEYVCDVRTVGVLINGCMIPDTGEFVSHKDNCNVVIGWMPIENIQDIIIYPEFLKSEINDLNKPIQHFISHG